MPKDRLTELQNELAAILEDRLKELSGSMKETEQLTRQIVSAELEIRQHSERGGEFKLELGQLQESLEHARSHSSEIGKRRRELLEEKAQLEAEAREVELDLQRARKSSDEARAQLEEMEAEAKALRNENAKLKLQVKSLSENIEGMRRLRDEQMLSVMNLTKELQQVATGKE